MIEIHYEIQNWVLESNPRNYQFKNLKQFRQEKTKTSIKNSKSASIKIDGQDDIVKGINRINSSVIKDRDVNLTFALIRKTCKNPEKKHKIALHMFYGFKKHSNSGAVEFYHYDDSYDLILCNPLLTLSAQRNLARTISLISHTNSDTSGLKFRTQFLIFQMNGTNPLDRVIEFGINLMIPSCHGNISGAIINFCHKDGKIYDQKTPLRLSI